MLNEEQIKKILQDVLNEEIPIRTEMTQIIDAKQALDKTFMPPKIKAKTAGDLRKRFMETAIKLEKIDTAKSLLREVLQIDQGNNTEKVLDVGPAL